MPNFKGNVIDLGVLIFFTQGVQSNCSYSGMETKAVKCINKMYPHMNAQPSFKYLAECFLVLRVIPTKDLYAQPQHEVP